MYVVPTLRPTTLPFSTVATLGFDEYQVAVAVVPSTIRVSVSYWRIVRLLRFNATTLTATVEVTPPSARIVIVQFPVPVAVTTPAPDTFATLRLSDAKVILSDVLFGNTEYVQNLIGGRNVIVFICAFVGVNAVFEMISATILTGIITVALKKAKLILQEEE